MRFGIVFCRLLVNLFLIGVLIGLWILSAQEPLGERMARVETQQLSSTSEIHLLRIELADVTSQVSTMRGMGIGAFALLGVLDTIQLLLIRRKPSSAAR